MEMRMGFLLGVACWLIIWKLAIQISGKKVIIDTQNKKLFLQNFVVRIKYSFCMIILWGLYLFLYVLCEAYCKAEILGDCLEIIGLFVAIKAAYCIYRNWTKEESRNLQKIEQK